MLLPPLQSPLWPPPSPGFAPCRCPPAFPASLQACADNAPTGWPARSTPHTSTPPLHIPPPPLAASYPPAAPTTPPLSPAHIPLRSEERRIGKESSVRWS